MNEELVFVPVPDFFKILLCSQSCLEKTLSLIAS